MCIFISVGIEYIHTRSSGIKSKLLVKSEYSTLINLDSIEDIISYLLNNSDYKNSLSQYYTRYNPILSFIRSLFFQNNVRWNNLTRNIEHSYKTNIDKIQQNIDLRNISLILNLFPNLENDKNFNLESLFSNLSFGGSISYHNWIELANEFSIDNFLGKTLFLAPRIHDFLTKVINISKLNERNLITLETITNITFKEGQEKLFDVTSELLAFDMNISILRFLFRFEDEFKDNSVFEKFKSILSPWKNVKTFLGSDVFNFTKYERTYLNGFLEKILNLNNKYYLNFTGLPSTDIDKLKKDDLNTYETILFRSKFIHLKRLSITENQLAKVLFVLILMIQEIENLSWLVFGKSQGFTNEVITERIFTL